MASITQLRSLDFINLADTCAIDGITDDSIPFTAAYALAAATGRALWHPGGVLVIGPQTLLSGVYVWGPGSTLATIKLKNGANADLFSAAVGNINPAASFGTGANGGLVNWGFRGVRLDGNRQHQSGTSYVLRAYGQTKDFEDVVFQYGRSGGAVFDWNGSVGQAVQSTDTSESFNSAPNGQFVKCMWINNGGEGLLLAGGTDCQFVDCDFGSNDSNSIHVTPNGGAAQFTNCHAWSPGLGAPTGGACAWLIEADNCVFTGCEGEGSATVEVAFIGGANSWKGGRIFAGGNSHRGTGIKIGQAAGETPLDRQVRGIVAGVTDWYGATANDIDTRLDDNCGANGAIWFDDDAGNSIKADIYQANGTGKYWTGTFANNTRLDLRGYGLTAGYTNGTGSMTQIPSAQYQGFVIKSAVGHDVFWVEGLAEAVVIGPNHQLYGVDGSYATTWILQNGTFAPLSSASAAATATAGTITTASVGTARVAPTGNITGVILQAGTFEGQQITVRNESAFTVTFAASGTSKVAGGAAVVIAANRSQLFSWNNTALLWY